jgi:peptide/nickel transport system substrate-binding protein
MFSSTQPRSRSRRHFLIGCSLVGSAALLAACAPAAPPAQPAKPTEAPKPAAPAAPPAPTAAPTQAAPAVAKVEPIATPKPAAAAKPDAFQPTRHGGGGTVKLLFWQAPSIANPHHGSNTDRAVGRAILEPLGEYDEKGEVVPVLAREVPSHANGTLDKDGKWVVWRLKQGVTWHDGKPFTPEDVIFTWEYVADPATAATTRANYTNIDKVEKVDDSSVRVTFKNPTVFWHAPFTSPLGVILPKHLLESSKGQNARNSPFHNKPIGTGPYKMVDFKPGDSGVAEINPNYHVPNRPFFDRVEIKGGGDSAAAARAVIQTGEFDYAPSIQADRDLIDAMEKQTGGRFVYASGISTELLQLNFADPWKEVDGERASPKSNHPYLSDIRVRQAIALVINRKAIIDSLLGPMGDMPRYPYFSPARFVPEGGQWEYDPARAARLLDEAGYARGAGGVRAKGDVRLKALYTTTVTPLRQQIQAVIKKELETLGFEVELKAIPSDVFFSTDANSNDTSFKFLADIQQWSIGLLQPDPQAFMGWFTTAQMSQASNKWTGFNRARYRNPEVDKLWEAGGKEFDVAKRDEIFKQLNKILHQDVAVAPIFVRNNPFAAKKDLRFPTPHTWSGELPNIAYWYRAT